MAFSGVYTMKTLGRYCARLKEPFLAGGATATIGLFGDAGADVQLPEVFPTVLDDGAIQQGLVLSDLVECRVHDHSAPGGGANPHYHYEENDGPPFRIIFTNDGGGDTPTLDIFIQYRHSLVR